MVARFGLKIILTERQGPHLHSAYPYQQTIIRSNLIKIKSTIDADEVKRDSSNLIAIDDD
jgi:hypothetical protein